VPRHRPQDSGRTESAGPSTVQRLLRFLAFVLIAAGAVALLRLTQGGRPGEPGRGDMRDRWWGRPGGLPRGLRNDVHRQQRPL